MVDAVTEYVRRNTNFTPVHRLPLPGILEASTPKFKLTGIPTRTLTQVFEEDLVSTIDFIRRVYIPFYNPNEIDIQTTAVVWARAHREQIKDDGVGQLPLEVLFFYHTLNFMTTFGDGIGKKDAKEFRVPVAFSPDSSDFNEDLRRLTLPYYDNLCGQVLAMNKAANFSEANSTSRFAYLMTRFFWSGGEDEYAIESADILTRCLFQGYFLSLKSRFRSTSKFYR